MLFSGKLSNPVGVILTLAQQLNVKITSASIADHLENHPEYPSLLSLSDCLTEYGIANQAHKIERQNYNPSDLEFPFIAHFNAKGGSYLVIHSIKNGQVSYSSEMLNQSTMTEKDFLEKWSGIALYGEASATAGEQNYQTKRLVEWVNTAKLPIFIILLLAVIFSSLNYSELSLNYTLLLTVKLVGLTTSVLLLVHSIDANNPLVQNLCSLGDKNNCNAILKSDAAKVTSWLSWSEVGFFYFVGSAASLLIAPVALPIIAWVNVLALPYTIYSLAYQYRHKNWCVLCCTVQAVLVLEFLINLSAPASFTIPSVDLFTFGLIASLLLSFVLPVLIWYLLKPVFLESALVRPLKQQLKKFKYNSDLFNQLLTTQPKYGVSDELMPIRMGNPEAANTITMVSNPFCGPCAAAHQLIDEWLKYRDDIQLKIIFTTADHDDDERTKVARHISALSLLQDVELVERALNEWYNLSSKKYETWAAKYPISFNGEMSKVTARQKEWCSLADIQFTPTILVNGYKLPSPYRLEDIKYLLS